MVERSSRFKPPTDLCPESHPGGSQGRGLVQASSRPNRYLLPGGCGRWLSLPWLLGDRCRTDTCGGDLFLERSSPGGRMKP